MAVRRTVVRTAAAFIAAGLLTLTLWTVVPMLCGWRAFVVASGSMAPGVTRGDVVLVDPANATGYRPGVVATYQRPGSAPVTHRVVGRDAAGDYRFQGDANLQPDPRPVPPAQVLGRVRVLIPALGLPGLTVRENPAVGGLLVGLAGLGWLVARGRRRAVGAILVIGLTALLPGTARPPTRAAFSGGTSSDATAATRSRFYPVAIMDAGPVGYWRLGESGGNARADQLGAAPLTCSGAATGAAGAVSMDTDTATGMPTPASYCQAASGSLLEMTSAFSVIAWERASVWPETFHGRIVAKYDAGLDALNYMLAWDYAGTSMRALIDTNTGRHAAIKSMPADTNWHQIAMTWDEVSLRLYVDGLPADGVPAGGTPVTTTAATTIGCTTTESMVGDVDEVAIFDRALSTAEIADLYSLA
jgi:signal peptidase I